MFDVQYNDIRSSSLKVFAKERPSIPAAKRARKEIEVPGVDGTYIQDEGYFESTEISISMNYIGLEDKWFGRWRDVQKWLSGTNGELILTDNPNYYYRISHVNLSDNEHKGRSIGDFTATFITRDGLQYFRSGKEKYDLEDLSWNPGEIAFPDYYISGVGTCVISVNGENFEAKLNGSIVLDTERRLIYLPDKTIVNNIGKGNFENLYLQSGQNDISISEGFSVKVVPHWRCR